MKYLNDAGNVLATFAQPLRDGGENRSPGAANLRGFVFLSGNYVDDRQHGCAAQGLEKVFERDGHHCPHHSDNAKHVHHGLAEVNERPEGREADRRDGRHCERLSGSASDTHGVSPQLSDLSVNFFEFSGSEE